MQYCAEPHCPEKVERGRCPKHRTVQFREDIRRRGTAQERGYTSKWAAYSKARLAKHPWCVGYPTGFHGTDRVLAECTDHIKPMKDHPELAFEESNLQSLCLACNTRKAIREEGGFGR